MMLSLGTLVAGDTASAVQVPCQDQDGNIIDLTGAAVVLRFKIGSNAVVVRAMTVLLPSMAGVAQYTFQSGELVAGTMQGEVQVTLPGGAIITQACVFTLTVRSLLS